jgi:hypothetical protein
LTEIASKKPYKYKQFLTDCLSLGSLSKSFFCPYTNNSSSNYHGIVKMLAASQCVDVSTSVAGAVFGLAGKALTDPAACPGGQSVTPVISGTCTVETPHDDERAPASKMEYKTVNEAYVRLLVPNCH